MRNIGVIPWTVFNLLPFSPFSSQPWALLSLYQAPDLTFLYRAGQIELADSSAQSSLSWQFTLKPNWAGRRVCPELKPLAFQNTISQVENPNLSSVPGFHTGNCWQFSLQFSICLESVCSLHSFRPTGLSLSPVPSLLGTAGVHGSVSIVTVAYEVKAVIKKVSQKPKGLGISLALRNSKA